MKQVYKVLKFILCDLNDQICGVIWDYGEYIPKPKCNKCCYYKKEILKKHKIVPCSFSSKKVKGKKAWSTLDELIRWLKGDLINLNYQLKTHKDNEVIVDMIKKEKRIKKEILKRLDEQ